MELIVISETKLKIMLSAPDMRRYELETARMDCADEGTRRAFRHIFDDARSRVGFDTAGERLFVQLYTSKGGGCEIFVTKLGERGSDAIGGGWLPAEAVSENEAVSEDDGRGGDAPLLGVGLDTLSEAEKALLRRVFAEEQEAIDMNAATERRLTEACIRPAAFAFSRLDELLGVCRRLGTAGYSGDSRVYIEERRSGDRWYLLLEIPDTALYRLPRELAFLAEYGQELETGGLSLYLGEHGRAICETNAVALLGAL